MKTKITKIDKLKYHRNGVNGESFYSCLVTIKEDKTINKNYLVTFETDESDLEVIKQNCRVINLDDVSLTWRGDNFAIWLNESFVKELEFAESIYNLSIKK